MSMLRLSSASDVTFGGLTGARVEGLDHPFVVVFGRNEAGKSTLAEFLAWMIAGPEGDAASAQRFGDAGTVVGGRITGELGDKPLDIEGAFKVLARGTPSDDATRGQAPPRRGTIGGADVTSESLRERFGQLSPAQYALLLRFRAETMHDLVNESQLVDMFSRYATGSLDSSIEPRDVIDALESRMKVAEKSVKELAVQQADVVKRIATAAVRPAEIRDLESKASGLVERDRELRARVESISALLAVVRAAVSSYDKQQELRAAQAVLGNTPPVSAEWSTIVDVLAEVEAAAEKVMQAEGEVASVRPAASELSSAVGVSAADLASHSFSTQENFNIREAAGEVTGALTAIAEARVAHQSVKTAHQSRSIAAREAVLATGEPEDLIRRSQGSLDAIRQAGQTAKDADLANDRVEAVEELLRSAAGRRRDAERSLGNAQPSAAGQGSRAPFVVLAVTVLVSVGASFVQPFIAVIAGAIGIPLAMWLSRRMPGGESAATDGNEVRLREQLRAAVEAESQAESQVEIQTAERDRMMNRVNSALSALGFAAAPVGHAFAHVARLDAAVTQVAERTAGDDALVLAAEEIEKAERKHAVCAATYTRLFTQRGVTSVPDVSYVTTWLDIYGRAVDEATKLVDAENALGEARRDLARFTGSVATLRDAPNTASVLARVKDVSIQKAARDAAEKAVNACRHDLDLTVNGRVDVHEMLENAQSREELSQHASSLTSDVSSIDAERAEINQELGAINSEIRTLAGIEEIPRLLEERDTLEESIAEHAHEAAVLAVAIHSVRGVVNQFELDNQGPVIDLAQGLIDRVDREFGRLLVERSGESTRLRIERHRGRVDVSRLSTGARTLVYMALRLAFLAMDSENRAVALPLLCDDPVVSLDDTRLQPIVALLHAESRNRQVLLFTCHQRTVDVARSIGAHVVNL